MFWDTSGRQTRSCKKLDGSNASQPFRPLTGATGCGDSALGYPISAQDAAIHAGTLK